MDQYFLNKMKDGRFLRKLEKRSSGCWEWLGALNSDGYGSCSVRYPNNKITSQSAHRVSWKLFVGDIPAGKFVCHKCDNPKCVNPDHLFLGTHKDNMTDRNTKGRAAGKPQIGSRNGRAKLNGEDVLAIRKKRKDGQSLSSLASEYNVSFQNISAIANRKTWSHI